jgi:hypothetical protein
MKLAAIALDYDGTIAVNDVMDPSVRAAIGEVRDAGIAVILVAGWRFDDLRRVAHTAAFDSQHPSRSAMRKTITICSMSARSASPSSGAAPHCARWRTRLFAALVLLRWRSTCVGSRGYANSPPLKWADGGSCSVIDGDYASLEALPGVILLGGDDPPPNARELARPAAPGCEHRCGLVEGAAPREGSVR